MADVYPDTNNLLARIAEIQQIIVPTAAATQTPAASVDSLPYWFTVISVIDIAPPNPYKQNVWSFEIAMILFRARAKIARNNLGLMQLINTDIITTCKQFMLRRSLITPTYSTMPIAFAVDSLLIRSEGYTEEDAGESSLAGSMYVLTFRYEIYQSDDAIVTVND